MIALIVILIVLGVLCWAVDAYLPLKQPFKGIIIFLIILVGCILILQMVGIGGNFL